MLYYFNYIFVFYDITGVASLRYITTVLVNNNNCVNNGSTIIFCIIWNDCLQCLDFVPCLTKTATGRTIGWVGRSSIGKGEKITKRWSGKGMKRPFWKYTRKYEGNIAIDLQWTICTRVGTLIVATIYLQRIQNRYMFRSFTVLQCSHQHCVQTVASDVEVVGYL